MRDKAPFLIVAGMILAGLAGLLFLGSSDSGRRLDASVIGMNGLIRWLEEEDIAVKRSHSRLSPHIRDLGIRILPLYDMDLVADMSEPATNLELIKQRTQRDLFQENFKTKLDELSTVVLLPKWTTGLVETRIAHQSMLIPPQAYETLFDQMGLAGLRLRRAGADFSTADLDGSEVALFHAQGFIPSSIPNFCQSDFDMNGTSLILACRFKEATHDTFFVADPDLMNNHGLSLAGNAGFSAKYLAELNANSANPIYVDTSPELLTTYEADEDERREYERSASDFSRFFDFPFSVLWPMLLTILGVLYWRGAWRFGPIARHDPAAREQSKTAAITAKARLLRLSGNDGHMIADFVRAQLQDLTYQTFGPDLGAAGQTRFFAHLARRDATLARDFEQAARDLIANAPTLTGPDLHRRLGMYKTLLEKVVNTHGSLRISENH